jgi:DNA-binding response OmpR family regulator
MKKSEKRKLLLIVEDNPLLAGMYKAAFERAGLAVSVATSGKDGLEMLKKEKSDLVLLDILMPEMSGLDVLSKIRSTSGIKGVKVIILTILSDEATKKKAHELGAADFLIKSDLDLSEIVDRVVKHL